MRMQLNLAIGAAVAALALSACGSVAATSGGTSADQSSSVPARHAPGDARSADLRIMAQVKGDAGWKAQERARPQTDASRFSDLRDLAQVKRDVAWRAAERAWAHAGPRGVLGGGRPASSSDSGLAGCASLSGPHQVGAGDYPKMAAQFAGSRWPDLRISGLAYVEIATQLREMHAYGGETAWFYQRLSVACAKHGEPLDF